MIDSGVSFRDGIASGCLTPYTVNETLDCSAYSISTLPPASFTPDPPPSCIEAEVGSVTSLRAGLDLRFENPCTTNNWSSFPDLPASDSRIVYLYMVPPPSFSGSGIAIVPILGVARFYVTGWDRSTLTPGCLGNEPHPTLGSVYSQSLDDGQIWGHFIP